MTLDVAPPPVPDIADDVDVSEYEDASVSGDDYRREELQEYLDDGAWERAFDEWAERTNLDETEFRIAGELDLFAEYDFFWDSFAERVGYHAPGIPENWREQQTHPDLDSWGAVSSINAELTELGQIVCDVLKDEYIEWESEYDAPEDLPDF